MDEDIMIITKKEYNDLINIKYRYHAVIGTNTIKLSNNMMYCRLCSSVCKYDSIVNKKIYDEIHFK